MPEPTRAPLSARLQIRPEDPDESGGPYEVLLDGRPLQMLLAADGLRIHFEAGDDPYAQPVVEMKFAPGALYIDLDAQVVADVLRHNEVAGS